MSLYLALLPFTAYAEGLALRFEFASTYLLPDHDGVVKEAVRLNALKRIEFDGNWLPEVPK